MKLAGVLLSYYEPYAVTALRKLQRLLASVADDYCLIVVCNGPILTLAQEHFVHVIAGDNSLREFSGWDVGLEYGRKNALLPTDGLVVFANDTFCHHNKFGPVTRFAFASAFRRALRQPQVPVLIGEAHQFHGGFRIKELTASGWVATYLFGLTTSMLARIGTLSPPFDLDQFFSVETEPASLISGDIGDNLRRHVDRWLLGNGRTRWYGAEPMSADARARLVGKAKSILCEKYLSAACAEAEGQIVPVFSKLLLRQLRRLEGRR